MEYTVFFKNLPTSIKAFTVKNSDDTYTIIVNSRLSYEQQHKSFEHELKHINGCDFEMEDVNEIEIRTHAKG